MEEEEEKASLPENLLFELWVVGAWGRKSR
jgi:hypothetical protein